MVDNLIVAGKYQIGKKLGSGSFGQIHLATNLENETNVAVKLEPIRTRHPQLLYEAKVMKYFEGEEGFPYIFWYGSEGDYNIMVMEQLGLSLEALFNSCRRKFSLKTALMITHQMISRVENIHLKIFLHRDIKPDNFLVGSGKNSYLIYIIDFGLAKRYLDLKSNAHIPCKTNKSLTGTARYASVNTHLGLEQSRRDDLEGILYTTLYFLKGSLPWQGLAAKNKNEKYRKIMESKTSSTAEILCAGFPLELQTMLRYVKNLKFDEEPDYNHLKQLIMDMLITCHYEFDYKYDWTINHTGTKTTCSSQQIDEKRQSNAPYSNGAFAKNYKKCDEEEKKDDPRTSMKPMKPTEHCSMQANRASTYQLNAVTGKYETCTPRKDTPSDDKGIKQEGIELSVHTKSWCCFM